MLWKLEKQSRSGNISRVFLRFKIWTVKKTLILRKKVRPSILYVLLPSCASIKSMSICVLEKYVLIPQIAKDLHKQQKATGFCQPAYSRKPNLSTCHFRMSLSPTSCCRQKGQTERAQRIHMYRPQAAASGASGCWAEAAIAHSPVTVGQFTSLSLLRINKQAARCSQTSVLVFFPLTTQEMLLIQQLLNHINLRLIKRLMLWATISTLPSQN